MGKKHHASLESFRIIAAGNFTVKATRGTVLNVSILGVTAAGTITFRDGGLTGTIKGIIALAGMAQGQNYNIIGDYNTDITVVVTGTQEIVVSFR